MFCFFEENRKYLSQRASDAKDRYEILRVEKDSKPNVIIESYNNLALALRPDKDFEVIKYKII